MSLQKLIQKLGIQLKDYSDEELIIVFNRNTNNNGWTSAKSAFLAAIRIEIKERKWDTSEIISEEKGTMNLKYPVKLVGKRLVQIK